MLGCCMNDPNGSSSVGSREDTGATASIPDGLGGTVGSDRGTFVAMLTRLVRLVAVPP